MFLFSTDKHFNARLILLFFSELCFVYFLLYQNEDIVKQQWQQFSAQPRNAIPSQKCMNLALYYACFVLKKKEEEEEDLLQHLECQQAVNSCAEFGMTNVSLGARQLHIKPTADWINL